MIAARAVSKQYPGVLALDRVDFEAPAGQVSVLVGENGAGKSTLMKILAGIEEPTAGTLEMDSAANGVAMIHQELNVLPNLTVAENIFLGRELTRFGMIDRGAQERETVELLRRLRQPVDPRTVAGELPLGQQQIVEIARAISQNARVVIMDEPTSALSQTEIEALFGVIRELKAHGAAIIYISHRLEEALEIGDTVTVLRDGRVVARAEATSIGVEWIVQQMTGGVTAGASAAPAARARPLFTAAAAGFEIAAGEIVGFYGLLGAGRTPLFECIAGAGGADCGELLLNGRELGGLSIAERIAEGVALLPESRQRDALVPALSVRENMLLASRKGFFLSPAEERNKAKQAATELRIRAADLEAPVTSLSGGNQQKVLLARYLMTSPKLLLLDEPTRGVDVGARAEIYEIIRGLAARGMAVMFASSELEEVQALATRIVVMACGRITATFAAADATEQALMAAATPFVRMERGGLHANG